MKSLGDFDLSAVIYGKFTTFRPSTGAAYTLGGTPALSVYKDNSTTQSTTGVTLTADFDSVTGLNHFAIDTSADGTFYSSGSFFDIVITTGTVDSVSVVGAVVASFTLRKNSALKPTTAGRTLDVSAGGEAGLDWANIGSPTTTVGLTNTTVGIVTLTTTTTTVTNQLTAAQIATGVWQDATSGDFTTASSIGKALYINNVAPGGSGGLLISGSNSGTTTFGALTITGATTLTGNMVLSDGLTISAPSTLNRAGITITGNGTGAGIISTGGSTGNGVSIVGGASGHGLSCAGTGTTKHGIISTGSSTTGAGLNLVGGATSGDGLLVTTTSGHGFSVTATGASKHGAIFTGGSSGTSDGIKAAAGSGGVDIRGNITGNLVGTVSTLTTYTGNTPQTGDSFALIGTAGVGLTNLGDTRIANLDAAITTRMATYTQPTGFLAATFPTTVASTTNITAGTITTVTNLTNAPTAGDFTSTMKTSIVTAVWTTAGTRVLTAGTNIQLPSNGLANVTAWTVDITGNLSGSVGSVTGAVGSVTGAVGSVTGNVGGNVVGTVASVVGAVGSVTGNVGGNVVGSVASVTAAVTVTGDCATAGTRFLTMIELDSTVYRFTTNALEQAPSGSATVAGYASGQDPATLVLGALAASWNTAGTVGAKINSAASAGDPLTNDVPGSYAGGTAGHALGLLGSGSVTFAGSVVNEDNGFEITQGDAYLNSDGLAFSWTFGASPSLSGATVVLRIQGPGTNVTPITCTVTGAGTSSQVAKADITAVQSASFDPGNYAYDIQATLSSGSPVTLVREAGMKVKPQVA